MDVKQAIGQWYSTRRFLPTPVPDEAVCQILEAGRRAPSWENVQPWHFILITDPGLKSRLAELARGQEHVAAAPLVIGICGDLGAWKRERNRQALVELLESAGYPSPGELVDAHYLSDPVMYVGQHGPSMILARTFEQLGIVYGFMALQAVELGLGCCMIGAFGNETTGGDRGLYEAVRTELELPADHYLLALLTVGIPDEPARLRPRKPLQAIASRGRYGIPIR